MAKRIALIAAIIVLEFGLAAIAWGVCYYADLHKPVQMICFIWPLFEKDSKAKVEELAL